MIMNDIDEWNGMEWNGCMRSRAQYGFGGAASPKVRVEGAAKNGMQCNGVECNGMESNK